VRIHIEALKFLVQELYCHYGFEDSQAEIVADSLVDADARGIHSHGVQRLAMYEGKIRAGTIIVDRHPELVHETSVSAVIDGHEAIGYSQSTTEWYWTGDCEKFQSFWHSRILCSDGISTPSSWFCCYE
jgi:LDH2 family malate/lactate/ureidoglycolate dehydrogenase